MIIHSKAFTQDWEVNPNYLEVEVWPNTTGNIKVNGMSEITLENLLATQNVETSDSQLAIKMPQIKLPVGQHRFNLKIVDDSGNQSSAAQITVIVIDTEAPTAVLDLLDTQGRTITDGRVSFGSGFTLSGKRSVDVGGSIVKYIWEVVPQ
jgi:hypothetical protein